MARSRTTIEAQEQRFAALVAQGVPYTEAFIAIRPRAKAWKPESLRPEASKFAARPNVVTMVRELLHASKLQDIDSVGEWHNRVQTSITKADEDGAHASVMTGHRMIGQSIGAVQQNIRLDASSLLDDSALIAKLAGDDEHKAAMLRAIIGSEDFEQETPKH